MSEASGFDSFERTARNGKGTADPKGKDKAVDEEANEPEQRLKVRLSAQPPISC
jgi:hypothetical protein